MANTLIQNCQRGLVFLVFLEILFISIMITIKLIKRLIDPLDSSSVSDSKYKEGDKDKKDKPSMDADAAKAETSL